MDFFQVVTLTFNLPPQELSSNGGYGNKWQHASAVKRYRDECRMLARQVVNAQVHGTVWYTDSAVLSMEVWCGNAAPPDGRVGFRDTQNAMYATKALIDAVVLEGLLYDDDAQHARWGNVVIISPRAAGRRREIVLTISYDRNHSVAPKLFEDAVRANKLRRENTANKKRARH